MSAQTYFTFTTPEEVIQRGEFFPYWEIRDEQNRFLMSRKPKDGEIVIGTSDHNNDANLSLADAINHFVTRGKGSFKFIRVKLGTNKNATSNHSYYAINLSQDGTEPGDLLNGFYPQFTPSPTNPNMFVLNGVNKNPQQETIANPMQNLNELLEAQMTKMQALYDKSMNDMLIQMERKMLNKEIEDFEKRKSEWEANKEDQLNGAIQSATTYGVKNLMSDIPSLTGAVIDVIAAVQDLKKGQKVGTTLNGEKKEVPQKKEEKKRPDVQFSKRSEAKQEQTPAPTETDSIFAGMNADQIQAMKEMAESLKAGKIHPDEVKEVAKEPTSFFEEEKPEDINKE